MLCFTLLATVVCLHVGRGCAASGNGKFRAILLQLRVWCDWSRVGHPVLLTNCCWSQQSSEVFPISLVCCHVLWLLEAARGYSIWWGCSELIFVTWAVSGFFEYAQLNLSHCCNAIGRQKTNIQPGQLSFWIGAALFCCQKEFHDLTHFPAKYM